MSVKPFILRGRMSPTERHLRSQLAKCVASCAFIHGTLLFRKRVCGRSGCHCAQGEKHPALYLVVREDKRQKQIFIPLEKQEEVQQWVNQDKTLRQLLDKLSSIHLDKIKKRE